ncbi:MULTISPECIES: GGDEF domain-containing protein [unclassified Oceanispirochaeta]|uniref:GGDEF domain-containing protein n=1 Tax=unclassified Oceanispirochaeta TaxID=2635722 RepID=UPI000E09889A|nr:MULTISPECIES: GGDEF domain-containing protein [unclassified Oceanispirochaeta]MBF9018390.1 GGDEF domain-containing protein [Oceanispirochaeta sp. M2]NPD75196.1 GGDEF domain-containing protein [Oceanispirochaeta sp. M1]RDG28946.1 GGDEF domain-containing protein [Oceanispirochaeta sp. M1]
MTEMKDGPNHVTLISICILVIAINLYSYLNNSITLFFLIIQLFSVSWISIFMSSHRLNIAGSLPMIIISPLMVLQLNTVNSLVIFHIIQALFAIHFLFKCNIKFRDRIIMYALFLGSYILSCYLHKGFSILEMAAYGGVLLHLLIISLGVATHQKDEIEKEADELRSKLLGIKDEYKDKEQDPLMGIFSKSGGMKVLKQTMKWSQRYEIPLTVCYMELNNSHEDYIYSMTRRIVNRVRESDTLFRLGKSEILLILPDCQKNDAASVMKSIQEILRNDREMEAVQFGLADFKGELKTSPNELIINANMAIA